ncbi:RND family efflux transporter, MFP subunit [Roseovarius nanhaiticus]|uniref:RND family efflux transporter, MFP subunit n=1 Tax=Roseovarius nanhaiticus TaxID=573024 RepID=A0A1N7FCD8_9RHOB|nr:efflux RND transporter periplasmic adaptor subunit [Roseovarius nanhaiticus]SEK57474.1 RND family efflux transporter, MFP subunit [Roseovarius nanhaiticus]SIR98048.1 RND family efflux transporter, MFP subunit [Roseovarius nanhaiticus]
MSKTPIWKQIVLSAVLIGVAAGAWHYRTQIIALWQPATKQAGRDTAGPGVPVLVAEVALAEDSLSFAAVGTGLAQRSVTLRAPSGGEVTELNIAPGKRFTKGDVLMRLEDEDQRLALSLAEARQERAQSEQERYTGLRDTGVTTAQRFEDAMTAFRIAEIELEQARADLADRVLRAPFEGIAGLAEIEEGDRIEPNEAIASFDDRSRLLVEFDLPEALLPRAEIGMKVRATSPSSAGGALTGEITAIDSRVTATTRTARLRAAFPNEGDRLRPGASFTVTLDLPGDRYPMLPELALQFSGGALQVWRIDAGGLAQPVEVRLVRRRGGSVIVDGPLAEGDSVVVEGLQRMRPGRAVDVLNTPKGGAT